MNVGLYRRYGWDGANDKLWVQSIRPLLQEKEMRATPAHVAATVRKLFAREYLATFGREPAANDEEVMHDAGKALAAYQETLLTRRTPFDDFRDGLATGYPLAAQRGLRSFVRACSDCHSGPAFSSGRVVGGFRVAALRNVARTAPYMHDGSVPSLRDAVKHRSELADEEVDDLVAFLESLTER
jgi:cytochrome c peroxidase